MHTSDGTFFTEVFLLNMDGPPLEQDSKHNQGPWVIKPGKLGSWGPVVDLKPFLEDNMI